MIRLHIRPDTRVQDTTDMEAPSDVILLGYWRIRGFGQSIRLLLHYCGMKFEERSYGFGEKNDTRDEWLKEKFNLGLDFPNLPYLICGNIKLTQSMAILRFLARRGGLFPETEESETRVDIAEQQIYDVIHYCHAGLLYNPNYEQDKENYLEKFLNEICVQFENFLGDRKFLAGEELTYVDLFLWETLDQHRTLWPECETMFSKLPKLEAYIQRVERLPKVADFLGSEKCLRWPIVSERGLYGGPQTPEPKRPIKY